jgi:hypothetical protein
MVRVSLRVCPWTGACGAPLFFLMKLMVYRDGNPQMELMVDRMVTQ